MRDIRIIIAGSRYFNDYNMLQEKCNVVINEVYKKSILMNDVDINNITIISGGANGADTLGEKFALEHKFNVKRFPADWDKNGKAAGHIRNRKMAKYAIEDNAYGVLIAFPLGKSKGTYNMINLAMKYKLNTYVFTKYI